MDYRDGTLEQIALNPHALNAFIWGKIVVHSLTTILPLLLISLLIGKVFFLNIQSIAILIATLFLGSPVLTSLSALGAALTLGLRNRGLMIVLLVVPLYIPVLIFGASAVNNASQGLQIESQLYFLGSFLTLALTLAPLAIGAALRISLE